MRIGAVGLLFEILIIKTVSSRQVVIQQQQNFAVEKLGHLFRG